MGGSRKPTRHVICYGCDKMVPPLKHKQCPGRPAPAEQKQFFADNPTNAPDTPTLEHETIQSR